MFKLTKILNSKTSTIEPFELELRGEGEIDIVANCVYHFGDKSLQSPANVENPHLFIPIKNYDKSAKKVSGYFVTPDMIFSVPFIDIVGDGESGDDFRLCANEVSGLCDLVEILPHNGGIGFIVYMDNSSTEALIKFKI